MLITISFKETNRVTEFLSENPLYVVLAVVLAIWFGILYYLFRIEKRVAKIEKDISES